MNMKKKLAMIMSVMMLGAVATACGDSNKGSENKTPHTTYSVDDINNMSNDELEKALENAASEIEMSEKADREAAAEEESEAEAIDMWKDVVVSFEGVSGFAKVNIEYIGDNQIIKDNVTFGGDGLTNSSDKDRTFCYPSKTKDFVVVAVYDEDLLREKGVVIKKNDPDKMKLGLIKGAKDSCTFPVSGLGEWAAVNDETDMTPYKEMVDSITGKAVELANDPDEFTRTFAANFEWIKNDNIKPQWGAVEKCKEDEQAKMQIYYVNEAGDYAGSIMAYKVNCFSSNGQWYKDVWMACPDTINMIMDYSVYNGYSSVDSFDRWMELNDEYVCFEIN